MNLKNKLFAGFTALSVVLSTFAPVATLSVSANSAEDMAAYEWAFDTGMTTMTSFGAFMFENAINREQAARFLVKGAEALEIDLSSDQTCDYQDLASADQSLVSFINEGCEMGIFKAQADFNPKDLLTREQAELTVARIVYGYDEVAMYAEDSDITEFAAARELLMADEIIKVELPGQSAVRRGHLLLMLYRLADDYEAPTDPVEVKKGALDISLGTDTLANNSQIPAAGTIKFASVNLQANEDVTVRSIEVEKLGLATIDPSTRVWFEKNGVRVSSRAAFTSEGKAVLSFAPAMVIKAGARETLDLYVEHNTSVGTDLQFRSAMVDSSAATVGGSFTTPVLRTVNYTVIEANFASASAGSTSAATANGMELGAFTVEVINTSSETRNATFKSITLRQEENASLSNLGNIVLERNGAVVSSAAMVNGRELTFSLNDSILDGVTATYYIKAVVNNVDQSTDSYEFRLRNDSDLNIVEATTSFRATVASAPVTLSTYDITGGDLTFSRDTSVPLSVSVAPGTQNVIFLKGTISSNQAITLEDPEIDYANLLDDDDMFDYVSTIYLKIGGSTFSYSPVNGGAATSATFNGTAVVDGTVPVQLWATLKSNAPAGTIKFDALGLSSFDLAEYVSNGNTVGTAIGTIETVTVDVEQSTLNVTRTDGKGNSAVSAGTTDFTVVKYNLTSNQGNGVRISRANFDVAAPALANNNVTLSLLVNGTVRQTKNVNGATVSFDGFNADVTTGNPVTVEVKANFAEAFNAGTFALNLQANGFNAVDLSNSQAVAHPAVNSAVFTIAAANAEVSASNAPILANLLLSPSATGQALMAFRVKALNDTVKLRDATFAGTNLSALSNFRLVDANGAVVATATTATNTAVTFTNIPASVAPAIAKDVTSTYRIIADVNSDSSGDVDVELTDLDVRASNGSTVSPVFAAVASATHTIAENSFVVAKAANASKGLTTSALRFTITASGKDSVEIDELHFNNLIAGYDTTAAQLRVYRTNTTASNLVGELAVGTVNGNITTMLGNNVVDAGTTATFIVVIENAVVDAGSNSQDWSVSLTDIAFDGLVATDYDNVGGTLPLTESK